jgi:lysylphosphatidylglycerol synthetase-like protein (DUF2156 family)
MSGKPVAWRFGVATMTVLAAGVALYSLRYYGALVGVLIDIDPRLRSVIAAAPIQALAHMLVGPVALLIGPLQFLPGLRGARPQVHRWSGRVYVVACLIAGTAALATAPYASGGPVAGLGYGTLAVLWIATTLGAWRAAVQRQLRLHRLLMRFSYAMTFAAVTLRLQVPVGFALVYENYSAMSAWLAYTAWIPNVVVVALYSLAEARRRPAVDAIINHPRRLAIDPNQGSLAMGTPKQSM